MKTRVRSHFMTTQKNSERAVAATTRLRDAIRTLRTKETAPAARAEALASLGELRGKARPALLLVLRACNDREELNRSLAAQIVHDLCPEGVKRIPDLRQRLASPDEEVRLNAIRMAVRV